MELYEKFLGHDLISIHTKKFKLIITILISIKIYYLSVCTNSITVTKRNTAKTTIQSTLEYKTEINEDGVKNFKKVVGYMGLQRYKEKHS